MGLDRLHHVGLMVAGVGEAKRVFSETMGLDVNEDKSPTPSGRVVPGDNVTIYEIGVGNSGTQLEVNSPNDTVSGSARHLQRWGNVGSFHHLCPYSTDIVADVKRLRDAGLEQIGADRWTGQGATFFHPRTCQGILLEIWPNDRYQLPLNAQGNGIIPRMHHVGILTKDLDVAHKWWVETYGAKEAKKVPGRPWQGNVDSFAVTIGEVTIEIAKPLDADGELAKFVEEKGGMGSCIHHVGLQTRDLTQTMRRLNMIAAKPLGEGVTKVEDGSEVAIYRPASLGAVSFELWYKE